MGLRLILLRNDEGHQRITHPPSGFSEFDSIIVGAPTYNTDGADHRSETEWDDWLYDVLPNIDVNGKYIAIFATGKGWYEKTKTHDDGTTYTTQSGYGDNFGDVMGELYDRFSE